MTDYPNDGLNSPDKKPKIGMVDIHDPSVVAFLKKSRKFDRVFNAKMEIEFVRVLEDLIEVLIKKDVVMISDFNDSVIKKLAHRKALRSRLTFL